MNMKCPKCKSLLSLYFDCGLDAGLKCGECEWSQSTGEMFCEIEQLKTENKKLKKQQCSEANCPHNGFWKE